MFNNFIPICMYYDTIYSAVLFVVQSGLSTVADLAHLGPLSANGVLGLYSQTY